eukprot:jgi/Mesvir1/20872/Mv07952-RA.1
MNGENAAPSHLSWYDLQYTVTPPKKPPIEILRGVSGHCRAGDLLAIMGSSGGGKTSLLNCLSGRLATGRVEGTILLNNQPLVRSDFKRMHAYVTQDDLMMETQTPRELLLFSARLRLSADVNTAKLRLIVDKTLETLGLSNVADNIVGNPTMGGLSGGERKRVNIGIEIIADPPVLFVDEPTSGLDSFTAESVMLILKQLATAGKIVLSTIHQPSSNICNLFDDLLILHRGGVAYAGPASHAINHFDAIGLPCPPNYNPADHYIAELMKQTRGIGNEGVDFVGAFKASAMGLRQMSLPPAIRPAPSRARSKIERRKTLGRAENWVPLGYWGQIWILGVRNWRNYMRDKVGMRARVAQTLFFGLITGLIFLDVQNSVAGVQDRSGLLFFVPLNQGLTAMLSAVLIFPIEKKIFMREVASDFYTVGAYYLSKNVSEAPFQLFFPLIFNIIVYFMAGLRPGASYFFITYSIIMLVAFAAQSIGIMVGALAPNPALAVALTPMTIIPFILTSGLLANRERLNDAWVWLEKISFMSYGYEGLMRNEMEDRLFYDPNNSAHLTETDKNLLTGNKVLRRFNFELSIWLDAVCLIILVVGFRIIGLLGLYYHTFKLKHTAQYVINTNLPGVQKAESSTEAAATSTTLLQLREDAP